MLSIPEIWESVTRAYDLSDFVISCVGVLFMGGKVLWDYWMHKKKKAENGNGNGNGGSTESIKIISKTYIELVENLRTEVRELREEVESLGNLKDENRKLNAEVERLSNENTQLKAANKKQEQKIKTLTTRVNNLANNSRTNRR